ncbi:D-alanine--D-alanine ligase [Nocardioides sp. HDW12B]|uniref:D-alanine--D-alanine ligase family protein n=1 Tax=Nocardioides sp. HDW12B TaxID=2714939 RepID=UPI00140DED36|nr:D-alanine--D-alanine ligase family protein [Nocardioides sp. HDW12B]QIK67007.1 D-alanine--D-alanine ligase [Nocardioides sp. HDW12B]
MSALTPPSGTPSEGSSGRRPRIALLFGGRSSEHAVSCVTAGSVLAAIDTEKYDVVPVGIATDGRWVLESATSAHLALTSADDLPQVDPGRPTLVLDQRRELSVRSPGEVPEELGAVDAVFPLLHGPFGEDGTVQGLLELADVPYVGSGVLASAVGMDKQYMKMVLESAGLPTLPWVVVTDRVWRTDPQRIRDAVDALGFPVFVKPCRGGSSIGISKVDGPDELDAAVEEARRWDPKVVVEQSAGAGAREVECGVLDTLGDGPAEASVPAEIVVDAAHAFYDFAAKYLPEEATRLDVPADLAAEVVDEVQRLAVDAFEVMSCEGLARVDFFLLADGRLVVNEINTMPGFTPSSLFPRMWAASGVDYPALVERLVQLALTRPTGLR